MCANIHYIGLGGGGKNAFGKQWAHTEPYCGFGSAPPQIPDNTWIGVKAVEWNTASGVHMETWIDRGNGFKLEAQFDDNGNAGPDCKSGAANPYTKSPCTGPNPISVGFRVDNKAGIKPGVADIQFKNMSVREITPPR